MKYKEKNYSFLITNSELNEYLLLQVYFLKYTHQFLWTEHYYLAADMSLHLVDFCIFLS